MSRLYFRFNIRLKIKALGIEYVLISRINDRDHDHEDSRILHVYCLKLVPSLESPRKGIGDLNKTSTTSSTCIEIQGRDLMEYMHGDTLADVMGGSVGEQITLN